MRITAKGKVAYIKLEDKVSGMTSLFIMYVQYTSAFKWSICLLFSPTRFSSTVQCVGFPAFKNSLFFVPSGSAGELFAQAPVKEYPGVAVETVSDSSRYFVLRIQDDSGEDLNVRITWYFGSTQLYVKACEFEVLYIGWCSCQFPSSLVCRPQRFHRSWLWGPRGRLWFQRGFAGPFQVSSV